MADTVESVETRGRIKTPWPLSADATRDSLSRRVPKWRTHVRRKIEEGGIETSWAAGAGPGVFVYFFWMQGFAADPVYGRAKCLPMLGSLKT